MTIHYMLCENNLTSDPNDYTARVQPIGAADLEIVISRMIQSGSTVTRADIVGVLEDYHSAVESLVLEGYHVNTPSANYGVSIKGLFNGLGDSFTASRHQISATVNPGKRFRNAIQSQAQVTKRETTKPRPNPIEYQDVASNTRNSILTPAGSANSAATA